MSLTPPEQTSLLVDSLRSTAEILRGHDDKPFDNASMAGLLEEAADELMVLYHEVLKDQLDILNEIKKRRNIQ
jgi:hypothetical protein